jgi:SagB-type dehydrogenase family enzyme
MSATEDAWVQATDPITLPLPEMAGGMPLMQALAARRSTREFSNEALSLQLVSNLLWAASGVNRAESGKRTAPTAHDWREIDVYVVTDRSVHRYDAPTHTLKLVAGGDLRALTGIQDFVATAPVNLVYVAERGRMSEANAEDKAFYSASDAGFVAQNVYLYAASAGLGVVVRGLIPRAALAQALGLNPEQRVVLAQTVGYPAR